eukprot:5448936-Prymnesium_polylepis.1
MTQKWAFETSRRMSFGISECDISMAWKQIVSASSVCSAHGDYLSVLSLTCISCPTGHRRARVALDTASRRTIGHRP